MLFHVYGENALPQWIAMLGVLAALILLNEVSRRTKAGGILMFFVIPAILTVYFIAIAVGAKTGASWALYNQTYLYMNGWFHYAKLYAALAGCIGFMMIKYEWGIGKAHWFKAYPFAIVAINILIAVASDFESAINGWYSWWLSSEDVWGTDAVPTKGHTSQPPAEVLHSLFFFSSFPFLPLEINGYCQLCFIDVLSSINFFSPTAICGSISQYDFF